MERKAITIPGVAVLGPYSPGMQANGFAYFSGQIPLVGTTGKLAEGGIEEQTRQALENVRAVLGAANLGFGDVVKSTVFLTDMGNFAAMNEVYATYFFAPFPARSTIAVAGLPLDALVEIEVVARFPQEG